MRTLIIFMACIAFANSSLAGQQLPTKNELIVAYYGRPGTGALGVLGKYPVAEAMKKIKEQADEYAKITGSSNVVPAFDIIYGLASSSPGRHKDYILPLSDKKLMEYIDAAKTNGFLVFIDLQLGEMTPVEAVKPVLHYLKHDNVHLAIDPEFEVNGLDVRPGKVIGYISGQEVNQVQSAMADYMKENGITDKKILVVHMFTHKMVRDKKAIKRFDNIDLVMNLDGHGSPQLKTNTYNGLYTAEWSDKVAGGFKLFFREDKPSMMTPRQVLGMDPVGKTRIKTPPKYINYQ